jgi:hypothetical protein
MLVHLALTLYRKVPCFHFLAAAAGAKDVVKKTLHLRPRQLLLPYIAYYKYD